MTSVMVFEAVSASTGTSFLTTVTVMFVVMTVVVVAATKGELLSATLIITSATADGAELTSTLHSVAGSETLSLDSGTFVVVYVVMVVDSAGATTGDSITLLDTGTAIASLSVSATGALGTQEVVVVVVLEDGVLLIPQSASLVSTGAAEVDTTVLDAVSVSGTTGTHEVVVVVVVDDEGELLVLVFSEAYST